MADDNRELTFEAIDAHIKGANLAAFAPGGKHHVTSAAAPNALASVCQIYHVIRPILQALLLFPLPTAWKAAITTFMTLMDGLCPKN